MFKAKINAVETPRFHGMGMARTPYSVKNFKPVVSNCLLKILIEYALKKERKQNQKEKKKKNIPRIPNFKQCKFTLKIYLGGN